MEGIYTGTIAEGISTTMYNGTQGYDKNGNIGYLKRTTGGGATLMDELIYSYTANQLTAVADGGDATKGFKDKVNAIDYTYDQAGNMVTDANKDLSITYNHLNLPASITRNTIGGSTNGIVKHFYAGATKVRMETYASDGTTLKKAYDYMAGMVYVTNPSEAIEANKKTLDFIGSPEGRAILTSKKFGISAPPPGAGGADKFRFEYSLKDHLGNLRVSCRCGEPSRDQAGMIIPTGQPGAGIEPLAVVQENNLDPWGLSFGSVLEKQNPVNLTNRYSFQEQENINELDLNWQSFKYRNSMPEIGRFFNIDPLSEKYNVWGGYVFSGNRVVDARELEGLQPHVLFGRKDMAAEDFSKRYNSVSINKNLDYGTKIYSVSTSDGTKFAYAVPEEGKPAGVNPTNITLPKNSKYEAVAHTHAAYDSRYNNDAFSGEDGDVGYAEYYNIDIYVATPNGSFQRYDVNDNFTYIINFNMPSDPNHPNRTNNIDPDYNRSLSPNPINPITPLPITPIPLPVNPPELPEILPAPISPKQN